MDITDQLKELEKREQQLAEQKQRLIAQQEEAKAESEKLERLFNESGYDSPRALVIALMDKFNVRATGLSKRSSSSAGTTSTGRRRRTKVTPELRDEIKQIVNDGRSMNSVAKERGISYAVVNKICKGGYDHL